MKSFIIAEAGVNHNGEISLACKLVDAALKAGADAVKFQTFKAENLVSKKAKKAEYQAKNIGETSTQFEMLKKLELSYKEFSELKKYCDKKGILFLSTPFEEESADFLESLEMSIFKIPSGEVENKPLIDHIAKKNKPIIISTGMSYMEEVTNAVDWIKSKCKFDSDKSSGGLENGLFTAPLTILHCTSNYPTPPNEVNLRAMLTIKDTLKLPVGYSDHTFGIDIPIAAVALGATVIEKHFTLDRRMDGPDHVASLEPNELSNMVTGIRNVEIALGDGIKQPMKSEFNVRLVARKSIVSVSNLKAGVAVKQSDIKIMRPGGGIEPKFIEKVVGLKPLKDISIDSVLKWSDFPSSS